MEFVSWHSRHSWHSWHGAKGPIIHCNWRWTGIWQILVGGLEHFFSPYIVNNHPNWLMIFRGVQTTNQYFAWLIVIFSFLMPRCMKDVWRYVHITWLCLLLPESIPAPTFPCIPAFAALLLSVSVPSQVQGCTTVLHSTTQFCFALSDPRVFHVWQLHIPIPSNSYGPNLVDDVSIGAWTTAPLRGFIPCCWCWISPEQTAMVCHLFGQTSTSDISIHHHPPFSVCVCVSPNHFFWGHRVTNSKAVSD